MSHPTNNPEPIAIARVIKIPMNYITPCSGADLNKGEPLAGKISETASPYT